MAKFPCSPKLICSAQAENVGKGSCGLKKKKKLSKFAVNLRPGADLPPGGDVHITLIINNYA